MVATGHTAAAEQLDTSYSSGGANVNPSNIWFLGLTQVCYQTASQIVYQPIRFWTAVVNKADHRLHLRSSLAGWTIATVSWPTYFALTSSISSQSKMPQRGSFSTGDVVSTSPTRSSAFIGSACRSELHSRWRRWRIVHCMFPHHLTWRRHSRMSPTCRTDAGSGPPPLNSWRSDLSSVNYRRSRLSCCWSKGVEWPAKRCYVGLVAVQDCLRLKTYLFRGCYETFWLWMTFPFPSHYLSSRTVALAIVFTV